MKCLVWVRRIIFVTSTVQAPPSRKPETRGISFHIAEAVFHRKNRVQIAPLCFPKICDRVLTRTFIVFQCQRVVVVASPVLYRYTRSGFTIVASVGSMGTTEYVPSEEEGAIIRHTRRYVAASLLCCRMNGGKSSSSQPALQGQSCSTSVVRHPPWRVPLMYQYVVSARL